MKRVKVKIFGSVQGIFFRANTKDLAYKLGVKGWVRNAPEGSVEVLFEGEDQAVDKIVNWCRKGPIGARVERVETKEEKYKGEFQKFSIIY